MRYRPACPGADNERSNGYRGQGSRAPNRPCQNDTAGFVYVVTSMLERKRKDFMEPGLRPQRQCERCGGGEDLYLLTVTQERPLHVGNAMVCCGVCRTGYSADVAVPLLVTPRLLLGLQRLPHKLNANLGRLLAAVEFG